MKTSVIEIGGLPSALSSNGLEKKLSKHPGVHSATVNFSAGSATVRYDDVRVNIADIKLIVHQSGYKCSAELHSPHTIGNKRKLKDDSAVPAPASTMADFILRSRVISPIGASAT